VICSRCGQPVAPGNVRWVEYLGRRRPVGPTCAERIAENGEHAAVSYGHQTTEAERAAFRRIAQERSGS
jgi:hypothetical protein